MRGYGLCTTVTALLAASLAGLAPLLAQGQGAVAVLVQGKGVELTMSKCAICHEIGHLTRTRLSRSEWSENVRDMISRGAPVSVDEAAVIVDYLATYYSRDSAALPPAGALDQKAGDPVMRILQGSGCVACHDVQNKGVGPAFVEIARRYGKDDQAIAKLAAKIKAGGAGVWGVIPMPAHPELSDADLGEVVGWILERR